MSLVPVEEAVKAGKTRLIWIAIFNKAVDSSDYQDRYGGVASYSSTKKLLMDYLGKEGNIAYGRDLAVIDVWLSRLAYLSNSSKGIRNSCVFLKLLVVIH